MKITFTPKICFIHVLRLSVQTHPDPNNTPLGQIYKICDQINSKVKDFISKLSAES